MITEFDISIGNPQFEILFLLVPIIILLHFFFLYHIKRRALKFGNFSAMKRVKANTIISKNFTTLFFISLLTFLLILSLLNISLWYKGKVSNSNYYILLDSGASMTARDLYPDRYTVAKKLSADLVKNIKDSKIGFISFSGSIMQNEQPTNEKPLLLNSIDDSKIENLGTDIGLAIESSISGFTQTNISKTIILISDGHDTVGIPQEDALSLAREKHIKIITFGVGTKEGGKFLNLSDTQGLISRLDEANLLLISNETGGSYTNIMQDYNITSIMEKISDEKKSGFIEYNLTDAALFAALALLIVFWLLDNTRFRVFP